MDQQHGTNRRASKPRNPGFHCRGEPRLDDLLDDPMMHLLWRSDGLEPHTARATIRALQALVRWRQARGDGAGGIAADRPTRAPSLIAVA
jgi:hypothetical protein